jgi:protein-S-isoprenylcysteine O-methyltransferase Ste14
MKVNIVLRFAVVLTLIGIILFASAGTVHYWQGWVFLAVSAVANLMIVAYLFRRNPALLERRMQRKELRPLQRWFQRAGMLSWIGAVTLAGLDRRFGWTKPLPGWITAVAFLLLAASYVVIFEVMRVNAFASATIELQPEQKVIASGPYAIVRHPMYSGIVLMMLAVPPALSSWVALVCSGIMIAALVVRLLDEETMLRTELPGYGEYCTRVHWRLAPGVF